MCNKQERLKDMYKKVKIQLTPKEQDIWNWAQSAAEEYWLFDDDCRDDGLSFDESPVSRATSGFSEILAMEDVIADMIYRIGVQLPDMANEQGGIYANGRADKERMSALSTIPLCKRIVKKLESLNTL